MLTRLKKKSGVTLLEVVVTIGILSIILAVVTHAVDNMLPKYRLNGAARDIASNMQLTRMRAISLNQDCGISFDLGAGTYTLFRDDGTTADQYDANDTVEKQSIALTPGVTFGGCTFGNNTAIFRPAGTATGGTVSVQNSIGIESVVVNSFTGCVRIQ